MVALSGTAAALTSPSERVRVGVIGVRSQGKRIAAALARMADVEVPVLCDVDDGIAAGAARHVGEIQPTTPRTVDDFRRLLDDSSLDAVAIATPDHWHAVMTIAACRAGLDAFVETPLAHDLVEGERILKVARDERRVVHGALPQRDASHFRSAIELVRGGAIGKVRLARAWTVHSRKSIGRRSESPVPAGVNYDLWLGPATQRPFHPNRFHHNWRWFWDYGCGELGSSGVPMLDVARWGLGVELPQRVTSTGGTLYFDDDQQTPDTQTVHYDFGDRMIVWEHRQWSHRTIEGRSTAAAFYGDAGTLIVDRGGWKVYDSPEQAAGQPLDDGDQHLRRFVEAVRTRDAATVRLEEAHRTTALCHLGNIAHRLVRELDLTDGLASLMTDPAAAAFVTRESRAPWGDSSSV